MLVANDDIWKARIQALETLITAAAGGRKEAYYAATVCQVTLDPPMISISPNPEYPICEVIGTSGHFGVNYLAAGQGETVSKCFALDRNDPDKPTALGLEYELTERGTPLLRDCLLSLECRVERAWDSGDHRTMIGRVLERRVRSTRPGQWPRRFGGEVSKRRRLTRQFLCQTGLLDALETLRSVGKVPRGIESGTREHVQAPPVAGRRIAPVPPGICQVGCGWWGPVHALELKRLGPRVRRFFASRDLDKARSFARRFEGEDAFGGLDAALADPRVDAVVLALPHHLHAPATRAALTAGKHVLVEKPLATTVEEAVELIALAEQEHLCLAVAEQYRLSPLSQAARDLIRQGDLGRIGLVRTSVLTTHRPQESWKTDRASTGGGVLLDVGIHYIDVLRTWFGEPEVIAAASPPPLNIHSGGEDGVVAVVRFPGGPVVSIQVSWSAVSPPGTPNIEVIGERGALELWYARPYLRLTTNLPAAHWTSRVREALPWRIRRRIDRIFPNARRRRLNVRSTDLLGNRALIEDYVHAITTGREAAVSGCEGLRDLEIVMSMYRQLPPPGIAPSPVPAGWQLEEGPAAAQRTIPTSR